LLSDPKTEVAGDPSDRGMGIRIAFLLSFNLLKNQENPIMNKDLFELKWKQIRSQTTAWWSLMSPEDLNKVDKANVKLDKYVTMLQVKYGFTREQAKKEVGKHMAEYDAEQKNNIKPV
jgi:hypothetical protein